MSVERMTDDDVHQFLQDHSIGILSLARDDEAYSVPESFGYKDEIIYFHFIHHDDSLKMEFIETTDVVTLTVFDEDTMESVIVRGSVEEVEEEDSLIAGTIVAEQAAVPTLEFNPCEDLSDCDDSFYRMNIDEVTGRRFHSI